MASINTNVAAMTALRSLTATNQALTQTQDRISTGLRVATAADNAAYWIGECYYRQQRYADAIREFDSVVEQYPNSDKVASAVLRKGYAHLQLGEQSKGVVQLQNVIRRYPKSDEANLARQQLKSLGIDPAQAGG